MARMRTVDEAIKLIKTADPDTALTRHALYRLVLSGTIPHTPIGKKRLIDVDLLERYLSGDYIPQPNLELIGYGKIRRIKG